MSRRTTGVLLFLMISLGAARAAHAQVHDTATYPHGPFEGPPGMQTSAAGAVPADSALYAAPPRIEHRRYWLQILAIDAVSVGLALTTEHSELLLGNFAGSAVVHAIHGNTRSALLSPLLRVGLPLAAATVGEALADCDSESMGCWSFCGLEEIFAGLLIGAGTALVIDYAVLARKRIVHAPASGLSLVPSLSAAPDRFAFGLSGRF